MTILTKLWNYDHSNSASRYLRYLCLCAIVAQLSKDAWQAKSRSQKLSSGILDINKAYCYWEEQSSASHISFKFSLLRTKMFYK